MSFTFRQGREREIEGDDGRSMKKSSANLTSEKRGILLSFFFFLSLASVSISNGADLIGIGILLTDVLSTDYSYCYSPEFYCCRAGCSVELDVYKILYYLTLPYLTLPYLTGRTGHG